MAQNREKDDIKVPSESPLSISATPAATISGCGSVGPGHGPDSARLDRVDGAEPRSDESRLGQPHVKEEKKRSAMDSFSGSGGEPAKRAANRCSGCRKRLGLTGFRCRCGDLFCADHRYSDRHDCSYDYKGAGRADIARENPVVRAAKILKV